MQARALGNAGAAVQKRGDFSRAAAMYAQARELLMQHEDGARAAQVNIQLSVCLTRCGRLEEASEAARSAEVLARVSGDATLLEKVRAASAAVHRALAAGRDAV